MRIEEEADRLNRIERGYESMGLRKTASREMVYNSVYLKRIEVCLDNRDILFDMDRRVFNKLIDIYTPDVEDEGVSDYKMVQEKKKVYSGMIELRSITRHCIDTVGNNLLDGLGLIVSSDTYNRSYSNEGLSKQVSAQEDVSEESSFDPEKPSALHSNS